MAVKIIFRENMPIEVYDEENDVYYKSIIQEVDEGSLAIGVPMKGQDQFILREKKEYALRLAFGDGLYSFSSKVTGRRRSNNIPLFVLEWPDEIKRSQRRQFYRLPVSMDVHYWMLEKGIGCEEEDPGERAEDFPDTGNGACVQLNINQPLNKLLDSLGEPNKGLVLDISGGGLAMSVNRFIPVGSLMGVRIFLQSKEHKKVMLLKGRVVRSSLLERGKGLLRYRLGVEFAELSEKLRDDLINFIFVLSREKTR